MSEEEEGGEINIPLNKKNIMLISLSLIGICCLLLIGYVAGAGNTCDKLGGFMTSTLDCKASGYDIKTPQDCLIAYGMEDDTVGFF